MLTAVVLCGGCHNSQLTAPAVAAERPPARPAATRPSPANQAAADFVAQALGEDLYEVKSAQIAAARAVGPAVKAFAQTMAADHVALATKLKQAIAQSGEAIPVPAAPTDHQQAMLNLLGRDPPATFDKTYMEQQVQAHEDTLKLAAAYAQNGGVPAIKAAAAEWAPVIQTHLDHARALEDTLNKAGAP
jgi:putative membrane protein